MKNKNIISLCVGDWSGDGHSSTEIINIHSNLTKDEINKAYKAGSKKLNFDFSETVARDCDDNSLSIDKLELLEKFGFDRESLENFGEFDEESEEIYLSYEDFANIFLFIVGIGNNDLEFEILTEKENPTINIGGYGLFMF